MEKQVIFKVVYEINITTYKNDGFSAEDIIRRAISHYVSDISRFTEMGKPGYILNPCSSIRVTPFLPWHKRVWDKLKFAINSKWRKYN